MRIGEVIGTVTLNRVHESMRGASYRIAVPLSLENLQGDMSKRAEPFIVYDDLGAGLGDKIAISEGGEAAQPFHPNKKPVDAYCAAIIDTLNMYTD